MTFSRILGIDYGEKRIGLAISDPLGITAQGLESYVRRGTADDFRHFKEICSSKQVSKCVVGLPLMMNGDTGPKAKEVLEWKAKLEKETGLPVETWDERLTTREVERLMISQGMSRQKRKDKNDLLAAVLILQNYLDRHRPVPQDE